MITGVWKLSFISILNRQPYKEAGDRDVREFLDDEPTVIGIEPFTKVEIPEKVTAV